MMADTVAPVITFGPFVGSITQNSAEISWYTDEAGDSKVEFGLTTNYGQTTRGDSLTTHHNVLLDGLLAATIYHFRAASTDALGNGPTISEDGTFTTTAAEAVQVWLADASAGPGDQLRSSSLWMMSPAGTSPGTALVYYFSPTMLILPPFRIVAIIRFRYLVAYFRIGTRKCKHRSENSFDFE